MIASCAVHVLQSALAESFPKATENTLLTLTAALTAELAKLPARLARFHRLKACIIKPYGAAPKAQPRIICVLYELAKSPVTFRNRQTHYGIKISVDTLYQHGSKALYPVRSRFVGILAFI